MTNRRSLAVAIMVAAVGGALLAGPVAGAEHYGAASLLPAAAALALVFVTREVVTALAFGVIVGGAVTGAWNVVDAFILPALASDSFALILLVYLWCLGGLIGLWGRTGGARRFAAWAGSRAARGPRSAKLFAWVMGILFHQGGTISAVLTGTTARPVLDGEGVSHEEASFLADATGSPVASIIPLNVWPIYVAGLVAGTAPLLATQEQAVGFYFRSIPFNFYGIIATVTALLLAAELLPWEGRAMRAARERSRATGELDRPGATPLAASELEAEAVPEGYTPSILDFAVPMAVLLGVVLWGVLPGLLAGDLSRISVPIAEGFALALTAALLLALVRGMDLDDAVAGVVDGVKGVTIGTLILGLAVTLGEVSRQVGAAGYLVDAAVGAVPAGVLPVALFAVAMAISFAIGSSWGTFAVLFPLATPLAWAAAPDPAFLALAFGAVVGGSVFGDQASPISDTTILSAMATGGDLMDHATSQLPLAAAGAGLAGALYLTAGLILA